jgi:hypothetical protein
MPRVVYLANVGTQDVKRNGQKLPKPRLDGCDLLAAEWAAVREQLSAPILAAGLRYVLPSAGSPIRLQLFVTDQPLDERNRVFWEQDTIELGRILQRLLPEQFGTSVARVTCEALHFNPADYNSALPFFARRLPELLSPDDVDTVYVAPVGGVDACNVALTVSAVRLYRDKCQFIYVMPGRQGEDGQVSLLKLLDELLGDYARQEAAAHLRRHDYGGLRETLRLSRLGQPWQIPLCDYADYRTRFDFRRASQALQDAIPLAVGQDRLHLHRLSESLAIFLQGQRPPRSGDDDSTWAAWYDLQRAWLGELFFNLRLKKDRGEWVDFLARLFRLQEAVLRLVFELRTQHSTDKHPETGFQDFDCGVRSTRGLAEALEAKPEECLRPETGNLWQALAFWVKNGYGPQYGPLRDCLTSIGGTQMAELRNRSIGAHGYQGVSRGDVEDALNRAAKKLPASGLTVDDLLARLQAALQTLGVTVGNGADPYAAVQPLLRC